MPEGLQSQVKHLKINFFCWQNSILLSADIHFIWNVKICLVGGCITYENKMLPDSTFVFLCHTDIFATLLSWGLQHQPPISVTTQLQIVISMSAFYYEVYNSSSKKAVQDCTLPDGWSKQWQTIPSRAETSKTRKGVTETMTSTACYCLIAEKIPQRCLKEYCICMILKRTFFR